MPRRSFTRAQTTSDTRGFGRDESCQIRCAFVDLLGIDLEGEPLGAGSYHPRALLSLDIWIREVALMEEACREQVCYECSDPTTTLVAILQRTPRWYEVATASHAD